LSCELLGFVFRVFDGPVGRVGGFVHAFFFEPGVRDRQPDVTGTASTAPASSHSGATNNPPARRSPAKLIRPTGSASSNSTP
jgi:hypothetical protein